MSSYFNEEQQDYMKSLAKLGPENLCYCGWYPKGKCSTPSPCPPDKSAADKIAARCPDCHNAPPPDGSRPIIHIYTCPRSPKPPPK
jgi:hypothetical protein